MVVVKSGEKVVGKKISVVIAVYLISEFSFFFSIQ